VDVCKCLQCMVGGQSPDTTIDMLCMHAIFCNSNLHLNVAALIPHSSHSQSDCPLQPAFYVGIAGCYDGALYSSDMPSA
jgi:hypothetical protein